MRIHFASAERPRSTARKLSKLLGDRGIATSRHRLLEMVAHIYGYRDWRELSASIGKGDPSPDDPDATKGAAEARRAHREEALRRHGLDPDAAAEIADLLAARGWSPSFRPGGHPLDTILENALRERATGIRIEPEEDGYRVIFLRGKRERQVHSGPRPEFESALGLLKDRSRMDLRATGPQDGGFGLVRDGEAYDLRTATLKGLHGEAATIRIPDPLTATPRLEDMEIRRVSDWRSAISNAGVALIAIDDDDLRTDVSNACADDLLQLGRSVGNAENRSERLFLAPDVASDGIASRIRQLISGRSPDALRVGEIRDREDAARVLSAARSGHVAIASLKANSMARAVDACKRLGFTNADIRIGTKVLADPEVAREYLAIVSGASSIRSTRPQARKRRP